MSSDRKDNFPASDLLSDPSFVSPAFGRGVTPYPQPKKGEKTLDLSLIGGEESKEIDSSSSFSPSLSPSTSSNPLSDLSSNLSPEDQEVLARQSQASKERFLSHPIPGELARKLKPPTSYEEARLIYMAERKNGIGKRGAPFKLSPECVSIICDNIRLGTPRNIACGLAGITKKCLEKWITQGQLDIADGKDTEYARVFYEVMIADKELKSRLANKWVKIVTEPQVKRVYKEQVVQDKETGEWKTIKYLEREEILGDGDWKGISEYLARTDENFRKTERIEQTGANGGPIQVQQATVDVNKLSLEERRVLFGMIQREIAERSISDREEDYREEDHVEEED